MKSRMYCADSIKHDWLNWSKMNSSNGLFHRIMDKATIVTANEVEINRISSQIFENVNQSMIENDCETTDTKLQRLTNLLKAYQIIPPESHLFIGE